MRRTGKKSFMLTHKIKVYGGSPYDSLNEVRRWESTSSSTARVQYWDYEMRKVDSMKRSRIFVVSILRCLLINTLDRDSSRYLFCYSCLHLTLAAPRLAHQCAEWMRWKSKRENGKNPCLLYKLWTLAQGGLIKFHIELLHVFASREAKHIKRRLRALEEWTDCISYENKKLKHLKPIWRASQRQGRGWEKKETISCLD